MKEQVYTCLDHQGNPRTGYKSGFGFLPEFLEIVQFQIDSKFRDEDFIHFPKPSSKDPRAKKPSPTDMSDEAWEKRRQYQRELSVYQEFEHARKDFNFVVEDLLNYLRLDQNNHELRPRFMLTRER